MISAQDLTDRLVAAGVPPGVIGAFDSDYELPESSWITNELGEAFRNALDSAGIRYREERFDCNAFSDGAVFHAKMCWAVDEKNVSVAALAFGSFAFLSKGHCICVAVHKDRVAFYEPQPSPLCLREVKLTLEDIQSCVGCKF